MGVNESLNTPALVSKSPRRCGSCSGCLPEDRLICKFCKDKTIYGGSGHRKQFNHLQCRKAGVNYIHRLMFDNFKHNSFVSREEGMKCCEGITNRFSN